MGTKAGLSQRTIEVYLRVIARHLTALEDAERRWGDQALSAEEREREQIADRVEWDNVLDMHELLADAYNAGALSPPATERFLELSLELVSARPSLEKMGLRVPSEVLLRRLLATCDRAAREIVH